MAALALALLAVALWPLAVRLPQIVRGESSAYHGQSIAPFRSAQALDIRPRALIFVAGPAFAYGAAFLENELDPTRAPRVYVRDLPELREAAMQVYARPEIWQLVQDLRPLAPVDLARGNPYTDRWEMVRARWRRIR
ncbi:MAG TPA: hypothetical protein VFV75_04030 [Candidatus Polarisedimenticolaceae bacterium]|nr:hypothetical protein [Candidatus Polarisedimenticolaceae bacterium]